LPFLISGSRIESDTTPHGVFVVIVNDRLWGTDIGIDTGGSIGTMTKQEFPDEPGAAKRAGEATPSWA
jgi:hypothetical protein